MEKQSEAEVIAARLRFEGLDPGSTVRLDAAAELRRIHAENEASKETITEWMLAAKRAQAINAQLLEALKLAMPDLHGYWKIKAEEAIAAASDETSR